MIRDPWRMMKRIHDEIEKSMERTFQRFPEVSVERSWSLRPYTDISETENQVIVRINAPGFEKEDFAINVTEKRLEISAKKRKEELEERENFIKRERSYKDLRRSIGLPTEVKPEETKAKYKKGVLTVKLKKKVPEKKKKIEVEVE